MRFRCNPFALFSRSQPPEPVLLEVTAPRTGERTLLGVENLLQALSGVDALALELVGDPSGLRLLIRTGEWAAVQAQLASHYPQARVRAVPPEADPLRLRVGEQAWSMILRASGPEFLPLRSFGDRDLLDPGSDPLLAPLGALSGLPEGERAISRLRLRPLPPDWSRAYAALSQPPLPAAPPPARPAPSQTGPEPLALIVLGLAAFAAVRGYAWFSAGESWKLALLCAGAAAALLGGGWLWRRWRRSRQRRWDPRLVAEKTSRAACEADLELVVVQPPGARAQRARSLLERLSAAYRHYDHPQGARFLLSELVRLKQTRPSLAPQRVGRWRPRSVLSLRELATLWHPLGAVNESGELERARSKLLPPPRDSLNQGALVGYASGDDPRPLRFPDDLTHRHHFYVARTRMGKSTLMRHLVTHELERKQRGRSQDAVIVVDPHADLVAALLEQAPEALVGAVRLIDLADSSGAVGINLLDAHLFSDRDRTADSVVRVARGLWEQWGPRMQSILEQTVKTLHEANSHPLTERDQQHTILDGLRLLSDDRFRADVLSRVADPYLLDWWARDFGGWRREYRAEALAPVQTRLTYYASSRRARAILGQPRSTIDLRQTILEGGVLLVSTAQGAVGRDVAALVGASLLNLVDSVIREQERLPLAQRRGALVVVDEMQTLPGVPFESMLSELGKYGARFVLATQSLAKLDDLSPTMRHTLLANVGCLCVFQVSGADARELVWELGRERLSEEDLVGQPAHHCYVRASVGVERLPAFSMSVRKPEPGDPLRAARIREAARSYVTPVDLLEAQQAERQRQVTRYRDELAQLSATETSAAASSQPPKRRRQRSKRNNPAA